MIRLNVSLIKCIRDDTPINVKIVNYVKKIYMFLKDIQRWRFLQVSLKLFKDDTFLSVIESIY